MQEKSSSHPYPRKFKVTKQQKIINYRNSKSNIQLHSASTLKFINEKEKKCRSVIAQLSEQQTNYKKLNKVSTEDYFNHLVREQMELDPVWNFLNHVSSHFLGKIYQFLPSCHPNLTAPQAFAMLDSFRGLMN